MKQDHVRLAALYRISRVLGTSLNLDEVLTQVMDAVISLTGAERGFVVLLEPGSKEWHLRAARNFSQETLQPQDMAVSHTLINSVIENNRGVVTTDAQADPRFAQASSVVYHALRSIMCAPLLSRGQVIGAIYVDNRAQIGVFTEEDLEMLNSLAIQAAIAIDNAHLFTRTDQALARCITELETLAKIDRDLSAGLDLHRPIEVTHQWAAQAVKTGQVWIVITETGTLDSGANVYPGGNPDLPDDLVMPAVAAGDLKVSEPGEDRPARLVLPIMYSGRLLRAMLIEQPQPFGEADIQFFSHLVGRAASAIQNAILYRDVQQTSEAKTQFISNQSSSGMIFMECSS